MKKEFLQSVHPHQALIHKICRLYADSKEDREDLFQEIIYQLWKAYPKFRGEASISTWMYRIGLNTALASFRRKKVSETEAPQGLDLADSHDENKDEQLNQLWWAVRQMNEADRALIALYLDELSYSEMAEILGISENNVGVRLNRIKSKIKKLLNV